MPAVSLDKIKLQSANLVANFNKPDIFVSNLRELLDQYSDRTLRGVQKIQTKKFIPSYQVSQRVMWQILHDLQVRLELASYQQGIDLASTLWNSPSMEEKILAIQILGEIPYEDPEQWLATFQNWVSKDMDIFLLSQLVDHGLNFLRRHHFEIWLSLINQWLSSNEQIYTTQALLALNNFILEDGQRHLPAIIAMLSGLLLRLPKDIHSEALQLIASMIKISPIEMRFFLREILIDPAGRSGDNQKLLRKMIDLFPDADRLEFKRSFFSDMRT